MNKNAPISQIRPIPLCMSLGASFGMAVGGSYDCAGLGLCLGLALGLGLGILASKKAEKSEK